MDWSRDSRYLKAIDQSYNKQFYDIYECAAVKNGSYTLIDT